jgi:hypothetical protein
MVRWDVDPCCGPGVFNLKSDGVESGRADQAGVTRDNGVVDVIADDQRYVGPGTSERGPERPSIQHAEQEVDIGTNKPVPVVIHRPEMGGRAKLHLSGVAGHMVVAADQTAEPLWQWVDDVVGRDSGWDDHEHAVAAVFSGAGSPRNPRPVEGPLEDSVELFAHEHADVVVAVRSGESGNVDREQSAYLPATRMGKSPASRIGRRASMREVRPTDTMWPMVVCRSAQEGH